VPIESRPAFDITSAATMPADVGPLLSGRSLAIAFGCSVNEVRSAMARTFARVRSVDANPGILSSLEEHADRAGIGDVEDFRIDEPWDEPTGAADYAYAPHLFREAPDWVQAAGYLQRISMALHSGGIAHLRFDTRPNDLAHRLGRWLSKLVRRDAARDGTRGRVLAAPRSERWVRDRVRNADLEVIGERGQGTADHWVVARRR
jgi:hypothetical protein